MHKMCHDQESLIFDKIYRSGTGRGGGGGVKTAKKMTKNEPTKPLHGSSVTHIFYIINDVQTYPQNIAI